MDNPWSSPWTTADDDAADDTAVQSSSIVFPTSTAQFEFANAAPSPWAEGDSFGDWAAPENPQESQDAGPIPGGFSSETHRSPQETNTLGKPNETTLGFDGDVGFEDPPGDGFGLPEDGWARPSMLDDVRSSSPDPWAGAQAPSEQGHVPSSPKESREVPIPSAAALEQTSTSSREAQSPSRDVLTHVDSTELGSGSPRATSPMSGDSEEDSLEQGGLSIKKRGDVNHKPEANGTRQVSKVQELVVMYDGIANKVTKAKRLAPTGDPKRIQLKGSVDSGVPLEFQDDEAEESRDGRKALSSPLTPPKSPASAERRPSRSRGSLRNEPDSPSSASSHSSRIAQSPITALPKPRGAVFDVDLGLVGRLFDGVADVIIPQPADLYDRFEDDFSSNSERKAWYLVSRQGSLRMHDSGDEESYTRVGWHGSALSRETFQIVRRWMDEAPLTSRRPGGPAVGKAAATFGWDQSSVNDPVDFSLLMQRREEPKEEKMPPPSFEAPPQASFENYAVASQPPEVDASRNRASSNLNSRPPPIVAAKTPQAANMPPPLGANANQADSESDDEWGEMMSSPAKNTFAGASDDPFRWENGQPESSGLSGLGTVAQPASLVNESIPSAPASTFKPTTSKPTRPAPKQDSSISPLNPARNPPTLANESWAEETEAVLVHQFVSSLPDLTYMLR